MIFALTGLVGSTMHYHSEALHCLHHADEQHITANDEICPICTITGNHPVEEPQQSADLTYVDFNTLDYTELFLSAELHYCDIGRAPPAQI